MARSTDIFLCFDLGGTKLKAALVNRRGRILAAGTQAIDQTGGYKGLIEQFRSLAKSLPPMKYSLISVASAGPLHPEKGVLLDPTNFFTAHKSWGVLPLVSSLKKVFKKPVLLENDAAAAVLAEQWKGGHGKAKNIVVLTLGTGVGVGVIANGQLLRAGRGLHPEASHIPLNWEAHDYPCGCGANGCIEAYLAGSHFVRHLSAAVAKPLTGQECIALARDGDPRALQAFREYGERLALAVRVMAVLFAPEVVVLAGGFSHASSLFLKSTKDSLPRLMERYREGVDLLPKVKVSNLQDDAGIIGAAYKAVQLK